VNGSPTSSPKSPRWDDPYPSLARGSTLPPLARNVLGSPRWVRARCDALHAIWRLKIAGGFLLSGIGVDCCGDLRCISSSSVQEPSSTALLLHHMQTLTAEVSNVTLGLELLHNQILTWGLLFQVGKISSEVRELSTTVVTIQVARLLLWW